MGHYEHGRGGRGYATDERMSAGRSLKRKDTVTGKAEDWKMWNRHVAEREEEGGLTKQF